MRALAVIFALTLITSPSIRIRIDERGDLSHRCPGSRDGGHRPWPQTRLVGALHTDELKIAAAWSDAEPLQEELVEGLSAQGVWTRGGRPTMPAPVLTTTWCWRSPIRCGGRRQGL